MKVAFSSTCSGGGGGGGGGDVASVFGRTGVVVAVTGDYTSTQVTRSASPDLPTTAVETSLVRLAQLTVFQREPLTWGAQVNGGDGVVASGDVVLFDPTLYGPGRAFAFQAVLWTSAADAPMVARLYKYDTGAICAELSSVALMPESLVSAALTVGAGPTDLTNGPDRYEVRYYSDSADPADIGSIGSAFINITAAP